MNKLTTAKRAAVVAALVEGNSVRATSRITGVCKPTILRLLAELGAACAEYHDRAVRNLQSRRVQCDEIWSFCYAKRGNLTPKIAAKNPDAGDIWTWTAIDADTKLIVSFLVGRRNPRTASAFMEDVASRLSRRVQVSTDRLKWYFEAVENAFGVDVDYATVEKVFSRKQPVEDNRYSPPKMVAVETEVITGIPDPKHISTSFVERQNLTMRMHMRRFTRLTNAFSRKVENHAAAVALHFVHYNFARIHKTLRITPAMAAGITDHVWSIEEIVALLDAAQKTAA